MGNHYPHSRRRNHVATWISTLPTVDDFERTRHSSGGSPPPPDLHVPSTATRSHLTWRQQAGGDSDDVYDRSLSAASTRVLRRRHRLAIRREREREQEQANDHILQSISAMTDQVLEAFNEGEAQYESAAQRSYRVRKEALRDFTAAHAGDLPFKQRLYVMEALVDNARELAAEWNAIRDPAAKKSMVSRILDTPGAPIREPDASTTSVPPVS